MQHIRRCLPSPIGAPPPSPTRLVAMDEMACLFDNLPPRSVSEQDPLVVPAARRIQSHPPLHRAQREPKLLAIALELVDTAHHAAQFLTVLRGSHRAVDQRRDDALTIQRHGHCPALKGHVLDSVASHLRPRTAGTARPDCRHRSLAWARTPVPGRGMGAGAGNRPGRTSPH